MANVQSHEERAAARAARKAEIDATVKKWTDQVMRDVPMVARFGKELMAKLRSMGYDQPEQLLFVDPKSLGLAAADVARIRQYQRQYLPKQPRRKPRPIDSPAIVTLAKRRFTGENVETEVRSVRFDLAPAGYRVLVERTDGTALMFE